MTLLHESSAGTTARTVRSFCNLGSKVLKNLQRIALVIVSLLIVTGILTQAYEPVSNDAAIFVAVGRALANGRQMYSDVFETKPPGMFLISAFSIRLTSGLQLCYAFFLIALVLLWIITIAVTLRRSRESSRNAVPWLLLVSTIVLYAVNKGGHFNTDAFGILFCTMYAILLLKRKWTWADVLLAAACMALIAFFREPYAITATAVGVLLIEDWHGLLRRFLLPAIVSIALLALMIFLSGASREYATIYLPVMLHSRGGSYSPIVTAYFLLRDAITMGGFAIFFPVSLVLLAAAVLLSSETRRWKVAAALLLTGMAMTFGAGTYDANGIPFLLALAWKGMHDIRFSRWRFIQPLLAVTLLLTVAQVFAQMPLGGKPTQDPEVEVEKEFAAQLDKLMDDCNLDRYAYLGPGTVYFYAFTRHSPEGPMFFADKYLLISAELTEKYLKNLRESEIVVVRSGVRPGPKEKDFYARAMPLLANATRQQPFGCARTAIQSANYALYYRKSAENGPR